MDLYGICLVKNEDDIIESSLIYAAFHCTKVFVIDNGSTDETWNIVKNLAKVNDRIVPYKSTSEPFRNGLRAYVYNEFHHKLSNDDWWLILDADEFLAEDPHPLMEAANHSKADIINAWQIQFYYTEKDHAQWLNDKAQSRDERQHIIKRLNHYLINWREPRLFRNQVHQTWDGYSLARIPEGLKKVHRHHIYNRHYQYRDPDQIQKRLIDRQHNKRDFSHNSETDWKRYMKSSQDLHHYDPDQPWKFSLWERYQFYKHHCSMSLSSRLLNLKTRLSHQAS